MTGAKATLKIKKITAALKAFILQHETPDLLVAIDYAYLTCSPYSR